MANLWTPSYNQAQASSIRGTYVDHLGDGSDATTAFKQAIDIAANSTKLVIIPTGSFVISEPIDTKGCSIIGESKFASKVLANPAEHYSVWQVGKYSNDVGFIYSKNKDNVEFANFSADIQNAYTSITMLGGENLAIHDLYVVNSSNCGMQFYGANDSKNGGGAGTDEPIRNGQMFNNIVKRCRWSYVFDGEIYKASISNNISEDATNRHITVDPHEAYALMASEISVINNLMEGAYDVPESWVDHPSTSTRDAAINFKGYAPGVQSKGTVIGNRVKNWTDTAFGLQGFSGDVIGNRAENDVAYGKMFRGLLLRDESHRANFKDNTIINAQTGMLIGQSSQGNISNNHLFDCDTPINYSTQPDTVVATNYHNGQLIS